MERHVLVYFASEKVIIQLPHETLNDVETLKNCFLEKTRRDDKISLLGADLSTTSQDIELLYYDSDFETELTFPSDTIFKHGQKNVIARLKSTSNQSFSGLC